MSSRQESSPFVVQLGVTNYDDDTQPEDTAISYEVTSDPVPPTIVRVQDDDMDESGRGSHYGEEVGNTIHTELTYNLQCKGDPVSIGTLAYWASHRSGAAVTSTFGTGAVGRYQLWQGGTPVASTSVQHRSTTAEFLGIPAVDDSHHNLRAYNAIVEEVTISGQRGGRVDVSAAIRGGGKFLNIDSAQPTLRSGSQAFSNLTGPLMFSTDCWLLTNDSNTGYKAAVGTAAQFDTAPSSANVIANSSLNATTPDLDYMDDWMGFSLTFRKPVDVAQSLTPGGNAFVQHYDDWFVTGESCVLTLSFIDNSAAVKTLKSEYEASTTRPWEVYMQSATTLGANDAYPGFTFAAGEMRPVPGSYRKSASIDGPVMVSIDYVPLFDGTRAFVCCFSMDQAEITAQGIDTQLGS